MKTSSVIAAGAILFSLGLLVNAQKAHVLADPKEANWGPAPPMLPPGAQIAVLAGDPTKPAAYTVRLKFPSNYAIPAHSHPTDEHVVVVSGAVTFGMGDKLIKGQPPTKHYQSVGLRKCRRTSITSLTPCRNRRSSSSVMVLWSSTM